MRKNLFIPKNIAVAAMIFSSGIANFTKKIISHPIWVAFVCKYFITFEVSKNSL